VHRALQRRGAWTQLSCFLCRLSAPARAELERELRKLIDSAADRLLIVDLGQGESAEARFQALAGELGFSRPQARII
jgi:CRISPR/Cas system-associated endoribonuclease Cas2